MAWKLQPLIHSEEPFFLKHHHKWAANSFQSPVKTFVKAWRPWERNNQFNHSFTGSVSPSYCPLQTGLQAPPPFTCPCSQPDLAGPPLPHFFHSPSTDIQLHLNLSNFKNPNSNIQDAFHRAFLLLSRILVLWLGQSIISITFLHKLLLSFRKSPSTVPSAIKVTPGVTAKDAGSEDSLYRVTAWHHY